MTLSRYKQPRSLYEPIHYLMKLGGKKIRPALMKKAYSLYHDDLTSILPYAEALDVFHNFTLMHDDIMDQAPLRRGHPTVHKKWNINTAILAGDVMLVKVYVYFSSLPAEKMKSTLTLFNQCALDICEGQQWDMEFEKQSTVSIRQYLQMIRKKTAALFGFSLELGGLLANASLADRITLRHVGLRLGMAFQLLDDWMDIYSSPKVFGKQRGGDIIANKKTYLLIQAQKRARGREKKELLHWIQKSNCTPKEKIKAITSLFDELQISKITCRAIRTYYSQAERLMEQLQVPSHRKKPLTDFIHEMKNKTPLPLH